MQYGSLPWSLSLSVSLMVFSTVLLQAHRSWSSLNLDPGEGRDKRGPCSCRVWSCLCLTCWFFADQEFFFALMLTSKHCNKVFFISDDWIWGHSFKRYTIGECLLLSPSPARMYQACLRLFPCCFFCLGQSCLNVPSPAQMYQARPRRSPCSCFCLVQLFPVIECLTASLCADFCPYGTFCSRPPWPSPVK